MLTWMAARALIARWSVVAWIVIGTFVTFVPIAPLFPNATLDGSWAFAINGAVAKGLVFGRDIIFTYGPYASAYTGLYHPATDARMLWSAAILGAAFALGMICLSHGSRRVTAAVATFILIVVARDALFFVLPFCFLLLVCRAALPSERLAWRASSRLVDLSLGLLVVALALLPLIKGTFAAASGLVMGLAWLMLMLRRDFLRASVGAVLFFGALPLFWLLAHQPLSGLAGFFATQIPIVAGYSNAMSSPGPISQLVVFLLGGILLVACHWQRLAREGLAGLVLLAGMAGLLFLAFKEGFVRQDTHVLAASGFLGLMSILLATGARGIGPAFGAAVGVLTWLWINFAIFGQTPPMLPRLAGDTLVEAGQMLALRLARPSELDHRFAQSLEAIRTERTLPKLQGSVDIYAVGQSILLAHGYDWSPRPILQSYAAYTPSLEMANARHLGGGTAPANVIFTVEPFGDRLPALDDGASWPALLTKYDIVALHEGAAILHRRDGDIPLSADKTGLVDGVFQLGDSLRLPTGGVPLWARIDVSPTVLGKFFGLLYKLPELRIAYTFRDGGKQDFRLVSGMSGDFLASPVIMSTVDFAALKLPDSAGYFSHRRPESASIYASFGGGWLWRSKYHLSLAPISFPTQQNLGALLFSPVNIEAARRDGLPTTSDCSFDLINLQHIGPLPVTTGQFLRVEGWGAISVKNALAPEAISLTLKSGGPMLRTIPAQIIHRDDINQYFAKPQMGPVGYVASADLSLPVGDYMLGLELTSHGQTWLCDHSVPIHVNDGQAQ